MNEVITEHFKEHFYDENTPNIEPFIGAPRNLNKQITSKEVEKAITRMSNNKAPGEDGSSSRDDKIRPTIAENRNS